ncbi:MAG: hypothetical protein KDG56_18745, partial [Ottowia sp.]|nr:hypothetical protein [Ottowia sp.]
MGRGAHGGASAGRLRRSIAGPRRGATPAVVPSHAAIRRHAPMIVRPRPNWLRLLFVWRGSILRKVLPQLVAVLVLALVVTVVHGQVLRWK